MRTLKKQEPQEQDMTCFHTGGSSLCTDVVFAASIVLMAGQQDCLQGVSHEQAHAGCMPTRKLRRSCTPLDVASCCSHVCEDTTRKRVVARDEVRFRL